MNEILRISSETLETGMVTSRSVETRQGTVLIPENTVLTEAMISTIKKNGVRTTVVYKDEKYTMVEVPEDEEFEVSDVNENEIETYEPKEKDDVKELTVNTINFNTFIVGFKDKAKNVEMYFEELSKGVGINLGEISTSTSEIFDKLYAKSDLMLYLHALDKKDESIFSHSLRVSLTCRLLGKWLKLTSSEIEDLALAGLLHDIGMLQVSKEILDKDVDELSIDEYTVYSQHPIAGAQMMLKHKLPQEVQAAILNHHERMDGSGFPNKKKGKQINLFAKIVAIADTFDELTNNKIPEKNLMPFEAIKFFESNLRTFSTKLLLIFLENIAYGYKNAKVELTDGRIAKIVFINSINTTRPIVRIYGQDDLLDLGNKNCEIRIKRILREVV